MLRTNAGVLSSFLYQQVSTRTLFDPNCSNHSSAARFGSTFGSLLQTFCITAVHEQASSTPWKVGSDLRTLVNSLEIITSGSCECLSLKPIVHQRLSPMKISRGFDLSLRDTDGDWKAGLPICPAWRNLAGLGSIGRMVVAM